MDLYDKHQGFCRKAGNDFDASDEIIEGRLTLKNCQETCDETSTCYAFHFYDGNCKLISSPDYVQGDSSTGNTCYIKKKQTWVKQQGQCLSDPDGTFPIANGIFVLDRLKNADSCKIICEEHSNCNAYGVS